MVHEVVYIPRNEGSAGLNTTSLASDTVTLGLPIFVNAYDEFATFVLTVTAVAGTSPSWAPKIVEYYPDGSTKDLVGGAFGTITTTGTYVLKVGPGLPVTANVSQSGLAPTRFSLAWANLGGTVSPTMTFKFSAILYD
jgi:hypothetical protein